MNINIYDKYKVRFLSSGASISQEDSTPDDIVFKNYENDKEEIIDGCKLLNIIQFFLNDSYLESFLVINNSIIIKRFNYNNGESDKFIIVVER